MTLTFGSVCSGIEAASVAWTPLGMTPAWFAEIEPFPSAVLAHRHPGIPNYGDFTKLIAKDHERAGVDVLVGGTPCQAFSIAGLRAGLADPRGNLALAFVALVDALRPRWVVWENVPGVLSSNGGRDFGSFLGALGELGYGWAYRILDAQHFALAQRRQRVFLVASPGDWTRPAQVLFEPEGVQWDSPPRRQAGAGVAGTVGAGATGRGWRVGADEAGAGHAIPVDLQNTTIGGDVSGTVDCSRPGRGGGQAVIQAYGGGNTTGPVAVAVATACNAGGQNRLDFDTETFIAHTLRGEGHDASEGGTGRGMPLVPVAFNWQSGEDCRGLDLTPATSALSKGRSPATLGHQGVRRLMPHELERLQGFPDNYTNVPYRGKPAADGPRAKALGNSMAVPCMSWIGKRLLLVDAL
jgi:DNA (cytosine-5)-methyltransferase 1